MDQCKKESHTANFAAFVETKLSMEVERKKQFMPSVVIPQYAMISIQGHIFSLTKDEVVALVVAIAEALETAGWVSKKKE